MSVEIDASDIEAAGALFYSMLPATFFRGHNRMVAIRPQDHAINLPTMLAAGPAHALPEPEIMERTGTD